MTAKILVAMAALVSSLAAAEPPAGEQTSLAGKWRLTQVADKPVPSASPASIEFQADGKVTGNLGCNRFSAPYNRDGAKLKFGPAISTKMACPNLDTEARFSHVLGATAAWRVNGADLTLLNAANQPLAVFRRQ